jgi:hypothetical protein
MYGEANPLMHGLIELKIIKDNPARTAHALRIPAIHAIDIHHMLRPAEGASREQRIHAPSMGQTYGCVNSHRRVRAQDGWIPSDEKKESVALSHNLSLFDQPITIAYDAEIFRSEEI